jgi:multidrug efflux system outer membrane protein
MGRGVQGFDIRGQTLEGIEVPEVRPGLPSELLTRRPDLVQAEIQLRNAAISVDTARLNFLPSISLSGSTGSSSAALIDIISDPAQTSFSLSANLAQSLLDNGSRRRNVERARITLESQLASYRQTVISVFNEIDVNLNSMALTKEQGDIIQQQLGQAEEQFRLAELRYEQGVTNFQTVIQAQNQLVSARNQVLSNRLTQLNDVLNFYVALGGGWEAGELLVEQPEYAVNNTN